MSLRGKVTVWALRVGLAVVFFGAWYWSTESGAVSSLLLPTLGAIWHALITILSEDETWVGVGITLLELAGGLFLAIGLGFLSGFWAARTEFRTRVFEPMFAWGYMAPLIMFYPVIVLWAGIDVWSKVLYAAIAGYFPIAFNACRGFRMVDPHLVRAGRAFGASKSQVDWQIKLRAAIPGVTAGLRIGAASCMIATIVAEMLASTKGIGYLLARNAQTFATASAFAVIVLILGCVAVYHLATNLVMNALDKGRP
jgi:ABC-type nitrate/sulfonate/bicarbonate transport system permease component